MSSLTKREYKRLNISELCDISSSKRIYASDYQPEGIPFYRGKEIIEKYKGSVDVSTQLFISESKYNEIKNKYGVPEIGDLLLTSVGSLGIPYIVKNGDRFYFKDGNLTWFRNFKGLESRYLYYWLLSPSGKAELNKSTIGSSQSAFTIVLLKSMVIELPPLDTQRKIASILSAYDNLIENNLRRIKILEEMAQNLYREWFVKFRFPGHENVRFVDSPLGLIPERWCIKNVEELCDYISRGVTPKYETGSGRFIINQKSNAGGEILSSYLKELVSDFVVPETKYARTGDLLINCLGEGTIGRVHLFLFPDNEWAVDQHMSICRSKNLPNIVYLYYVMNSPEGQAKIHSLKSGGTNMTTFNMSDLKAFAVVFPSELILEQFYKIAWDYLKLKKSLQQKVSILRRTRDLLLPKLISGEVDVSELDVTIPEEN
jgi:type I restriction enzyme, S subunit